MCELTQCCPMTATSRKGGNVLSKNSRYMPGMSPAVVFVATLSSVAFVGVVLVAAVVAAIQAFFFLVLPLAAAGVGAFLIASPQVSPLASSPSNETVLLLVRALGALALAYSGGAMLVGASGRSQARCMHLKLMTAVLGALTFAVSQADEAALSAELRAEAGFYLVRMTFAALVGSAIAAAGPLVTQKIQAGKSGSPGMLCS